jgi:hypothetical protein
MVVDELSTPYHPALTTARSTRSAAMPKAAGAIGRTPLCNFGGLRRFAISAVRILRRFCCTRIHNPDPPCSMLHYEFLCRLL